MANPAQLDTPALLIEKSVLELNLAEMQAFATSQGLRLRPHVKSHKMVSLARRQLAAGAVGIAVAKLGEAEIMADGGINNIQIANQIVGEQKFARLLALAERATVSCAVDSLENARALSSFFNRHGRRLNVLVEIDTGLHRCGLSSNSEVLELVRQLRELPGLVFLGLMTHAGHAYSATNESEISEIGRREAGILIEMAGVLRANGIAAHEISVGSTPTARYCGIVPGVTELRVGNYVFNDWIQVELGTVEPSRCALSVLATVISTPAPDRVVIDAGSKAFSLDRGAHGSQRLTGYGHILGRNAFLERLSEEHGVIRHMGESFGLGERLRIIPNHACAVVNLFDHAHLVDAEKVVEEIPIDARGKQT